MELTVTVYDFEKEGRLEHSVEAKVADRGDTIRLGWKATAGFRRAQQMARLEELNRAIRKAVDEFYETATPEDFAVAKKP